MVLNKQWVFEIFGTIFIMVLLVGVFIIYQTVVTDVQVNEGIKLVFKVGFIAFGYMFFYLIYLLYNHICKGKKYYEQCILPNKAFTWTVYRNSFIIEVNGYIHIFSLRNKDIILDKILMGLPIIYYYDRKRNFIKYELDLNINEVGYYK